MRLQLLASLLALTIPAAAQNHKPDQKPAPELPAAKSPEATALLDKACAKMLALGRGTFSTSEEADLAMLRGQGLPFGNEATEVRGGWNDAMRWGETDDDQFAIAAGRMVTKGKGGWKLRSSTLASGHPVPFLLDPKLLFEQLAALPAAQKQVEAVEASEVGGRPVAILTLLLRDDQAADFAQSGAMPTINGGGFMFRGMGMGEVPEKTYEVDLALFVDPTNGDVLRMRAKVFEENPIMGNVMIQVAGGGGGGDDEAKDEDDEKAKDEGKIKKGLPVRKPSKSQSTAYLKVDFKDLGMGTAPEIDAAGKRWLGAK